VDGHIRCVRGAHMFKVVDPVSTREHSSFPFSRKSMPVSSLDASRRISQAPACSAQQSGEWHGEARSTHHSGRMIPNHSPPQG
jgi:hypothetical protein